MAASAVPVNESMAGRLHKHSCNSLFLSLLASSHNLMLDRLEHTARNGLGGRAGPIVCTTLENLNLADASQCSKISHSRCVQHLEVRLRPIAQALMPLDVRIS